VGLSAIISEDYRQPRTQQTINQLIMPYNIHPKTNRCILFLQFVMENYSWSEGGQEWTDKEGRNVYSIEDMYRAFNKSKSRHTS